MSDNVCNNGYDDLEDFNIGEEYQEADGDCVEEEYFYEEDAENPVTEAVEEEDVEKAEENADEGEKEEEAEENDNQYEYPLGEESVDLHGEEDEDNVVFSSDRNQPDEECEEEESGYRDNEEEDISQDEEDVEEKEDVKEGDEGEEEQEEEKKEEEAEEKEVECTMTEEEKHAEYVILDGFQRQIDEEQYTLRKLRSIIGYQTDDIERLRRKIAGYTKEAEDRKAMLGMEKLKVLKAEREAAVEERRVSTDAQAEVRTKRNEKLQELKEKGLKIDARATYLIEDKELKELLQNIKSTLKYNSFATLKVSMEELEDIIFNVANMCDEIDDFLTTKKEVKPRDINKLNTKERRVSVLYDKLVKWRQYKVENPDIRPTDYESYKYDPEDMFSDNEEEKRKRKESPPRREIRAVRGGSSDKSPVKERVSSKIRTPIRAPSPKKSSPAPRPERRAVRGGSDDEEGDVRPLRAERGAGASSSGSRRVPPVGDVRKRRAGPIEGGPNFKKRNMSPDQSHRRSRFSPVRSNRASSPRMERRQSPREERRSSGPPRSERGRQESGRARNTPLLRTPNSNYDNRRSPSPNFKGSGRRENFQISVKNESYRSRSPIQERGYRHERLSPDNRSAPRSRGSFRGSRGGNRGRFNSRRPRRGNNFNNDRREDSYRR